MFVIRPITFSIDSICDSILRYIFLPLFLYLLSVIYLMHYCILLLSIISNIHSQLVNCYSFHNLINKDLILGAEKGATAHYCTFPIGKVFLSETFLLESKKVTLQKLFVTYCIRIKMLLYH